MSEEGESAADGLFVRMQKLRFIASCIVLKKCFVLSRSVSEYLQRENIDLVSAVSGVQSLKDFLSSFRNKEKMDQFLLEARDYCKDKGFVVKISIRLMTKIQTDESVGAQFPSILTTWGLAPSALAVSPLPPQLHQPGDATALVATLSSLLTIQDHFSEDYFKRCFYLDYLRHQDFVSLVHDSIPLEYGFESWLHNWQGASDIRPDR